MSSDLQSTVQLQLSNNDITFATLTVMVYDYILMFPSEVEYIWNKPWTWVTMLYLIVRYAGIYYAIKVSFFGSTFFPGPVKFRCVGFGYSGDWAFAAFYCAASLLMVLRVYAIWSRSKVILTILLLCYTANVVAELVWTAVFENPYVDATVGTIQVLDYSICTEVYPVIGPYEKYTIVRPILFDVLVFILALVQLVKQSLTMYKATGFWEPNRFMSLIVKEGVAYLFLSLLNNIPNAITNFDNPLAPVWYLILSFFYVVTMFPIFPRFVINMREMFDKDTCGRDPVVGIDGAFGITSRTAVSAILFVDGSTSRSGEESGDDIQLVDIRGNDSDLSSSV